MNMNRFNNFDPSNGFDPDNFAGCQGNAANLNGNATAKVDGLTVMTGNTQAQFDIKVVNAQAAAVNVQLFNFIKSVANVLDANIVNINPFAAAPTAILADLTSTIFWDKDGNLIIRDAADADCKISCKQIPYWSLLQSSSRQPFSFTKMRLTVTNDAQIDNEIFFIENTWLGKVNRNSVNPRTYFNPNQFQGKIVDIPAGYNIDFERGLQLAVNAGETINISFFVDAYRKLTLNK